MTARITIFDTTLRDGEQSPGIAMSPDEKAEVARALERLGVDVIEAGFAISSPGDFEGVRAVARAGGWREDAQGNRACDRDQDRRDGLFARSHRMDLASRRSAAIFVRPPRRSRGRPLPGDSFTGSASPGDSPGPPRWGRPRSRRFCRPLPSPGG